MPLPSPLRRVPRWVLALALLVGCGLVGLRLVVRSETVRARLLDAARTRLEARLGAVSLGSHLKVGWRGQVEVGPLDVYGAGAAAPPVLHVERVTAHPRLRSLLRGRVELGLVRLSGVRVEAGTDGQALRALVERVGERRTSPGAAEGGTPAPLPRLDVEDVTLAVEHDGRRVFGPFSAEVEPRRTPEGVVVDAEVELPGGGEARVEGLHAEGRLPAGTLEVHGATLSVLLGGLGLPVGLEGGQLDGSASLAGGRATFSGTLRALTVSHPRLDEAPVGPFHLSVQGAVRWEAAARRLELTKLELGLGPKAEARATVRGEATLDAALRFALAVEVDQLPYQAAVDALPPALAPGPEAERLEGVFSAKVGLEGPWRDRAAWKLTGALDLSGLKRAAHQRPPFSLQGPFSYVPRTANGPAREVEVGPANPDFVPLEAVPPVLVRSVLLSEDAGFYGHRGFDFDSLADNLFTPDEDGPVRGGSTLTQQLAKNLFLSREKTFARKVREALLTIALEGSLSKHRMLEIYLNIIEWGPDIYGLGQASRHYFGKAPGELSVKEMVFLATIIPNPIRYHVYCKRGQTSEVWERRMGDLLAKLYDTGEIDAATYAVALTQQLVFVHGQSAPSAGVQPPG